MDELIIRPIAQIRTDFQEKFGIPRQSGRVGELTGTIVFAPEFRNQDALRGIEEFSHLWLIFDFSASHRDKWSPTVRPPRLGGNTRVGVFATRSPFRPNPLGLSCVKFLSLEQTAHEGTVIHVAGVDLLDGTPIIDIKPYIPYADAHPEATGSFADAHKDDRLAVDIPPELLSAIPEAKRNAVIACLSEDPRPSYQDDPERIYSMAFAGLDIHFRVQNGIAAVIRIDKKD